MGMITDTVQCGYENLMGLHCSLAKKKAVTILNNVLKNRDITLPTKAHLVKAMIFPVVMVQM